MKIWKLSQDVNNDYDTYDSCVVVAPTAEEAKTIHPSRGSFDITWNGTNWSYANGMDYGTRNWALPSQIYAELIGTVADDPTPRIILASFNAG